MPQIVLKDSITVLELMRVWSIQNDKKIGDFFGDMQKDEIIDGRINTTLLQSEFIRIYGADYPVYNYSEDFYTFILHFLKSRKDNYSKIIDVLESTYNPLHNYDRLEIRSNNENWKDENNSSSNTENKTSAYNTTTYQPSDNSNNSSKSNNSGTRSNAEQVKTTGNIGVTTSQQMVQAEIDLRTSNNIISIIVGDLGKEFTIGVW